MKLQNKINKFNNFFLTTGEAAAHCQVSIPALKRWIRDGRLRAMRTPGGHSRIELREFQRFLQEHGMPGLLFESNPHPMWVVDLETLAILAVNEAAVRHYGYSRGEFLALTFSDLRPPEDNPTLLLLDAFSELPPEFVSAKVWRHQKKDGTIIEVELTSSEVFFGGRRARLVLANDVTERKRAEEALRRSEEQYRALSEELERRVEARTRELRSLFDGVPIGLFRTTPDGQILDANPALVRILGYEDRDALLGARAIDLYVDPEDRQRWQTLVTSGGELRGFEARLRRPDGSVFWQRVNIRAVRGSDGRVLFYEGAAEEITGRKQAEAELQR